MTAAFSPGRTLILRERSWRRGRLSRADAAFLRDNHRTHVQVFPAEGPGTYRLRTAGHVGTIICPSVRLVIQPKIPLDHLFHLLDPLEPPVGSADRLEVAPGTEAFHFLAGRLARLLAERAATGLPRAYVEHEVTGAYLRGRLDVAAQQRETGPRKDRLRCRHDDFTADVPWNQVPRATAELVLQSPLLHESIAASLRHALPAFGAVSSIALGPECFSIAQPHPDAARLQELLDVCHLLFEGLSTGSRSGPATARAFLLDMERVFEKYVTEGVVRALDRHPGYSATPQLTQTLLADRPGQPDLRMRPDLLLRRDGRPVAVLDAKWKTWATGPRPTDVYQVLAYATVLGAPRAVLVYPGRSNRRYRYRLGPGRLRLDVCRLRVVGTRLDCRRSLERVAELLCRC